MITRRLVVALAVAIGAAASAAQQQSPDHRTPLFLCGQNEQWSQGPPLLWEHIMLAADSRLFLPCAAYPVPPELPVVRLTGKERVIWQFDLIKKAVTSRDPLLRRAAAQALGRLEMPVFVSNEKAFLVLQPSAQLNESPKGPLIQLLEDSVSAVRLEAANAIGDSMSGVRGDWGAPSKPAPDKIAFAHDQLIARLNVEQDDGVAGAILETLGRLPYPDDAARDAVEKLIASHNEAAPARILGVAKGLEVLIRKNPRRPVGAEARARLRKIVADGVSAPGVPLVAGSGSSEAASPERDLARSRRVAMNALTSARDDDVPTILRAAADDDWQVRRLAAMRMDLERAEMAPAVEKLRADPDFHVRWEMVTLIGRLATRTKTCAPLLPYFRDPEPTVVLHTIDVVPDGCNDKDVILRSLTPAVESLTKAGLTTWHVPAHAFGALARVDVTTAKAHLADAAGHQAWQVRAMAATAAGTMAEFATVVTLASDREPNVRTAAIDALVRGKRPEVFEAAIKALSSDDYQLIRTAAGALKSPPESMHEQVRAALVATLRRLTDVGKDTSRDPRLAIIERLKDVLDVTTTTYLQPYVTDFDQQVRAAAATAIASIQGQAEPAYRNPQQRYPWQPAAATLTQLPSNATIEMENGRSIALELLIAQAPVTVARFVELVKAGYYDGLTFHRVVPNFVIQGGSPGASEYMGADRYWRDELGLESNLRGSVGLSTRGRDTGDGQFYINLVDLPRLDHDYTIFARVTSGLDVVDRILEGAKILRVTVR